MKVTSIYLRVAKKVYRLNTQQIVFVLQIYFCAAYQIQNHKGFSTTVDYLYSELYIAVNLQRAKNDGK